jgi:hypothetical protein
MRLPALFIAVLTSLVVCGAPVDAADLQQDTIRAYDEYAARAMRAFLDRLREGGPVTGPNGPSPTPRDGEVIAFPANEDGILEVPGGLIHHWIASTFIADMTLDDALKLSYDYNGYSAIYKPVVSSRVLSHVGNVYRIQMRITASGGGLSAVLDVTSHVQYVFPDSSSVYSIAMSEDIREVKDAGTPNERRLPPGHDSGYLWRAATFTSIVARDRGLLIQNEVIGLSRAFPPFLGWFMEPIARRLGRASVERSLQEFATALRSRQRNAALAKGH